MKKKLRPVIDFILFLFVAVLFGLSHIVPYKIYSKFGAYFGSALFFVFKIFNLRRHRIAIKSLSIAFPKFNLEQKNRIIRELFQNLSRFCMDFFYLRRVNQKFFDKYVTINNWEIIDKVLNQNKGVVFLTAHMGNWELLHKYFKLRNKQDIYVIYRPLNNFYLERLHKWIRGTKHISKKGPSKNQIVRQMHSNSALAILFDQRNKNGAVLKFFGQDALTSIAVEKMIIKFNKPIVPIICVRDKVQKHKFHVHIQEPLKIDTEQPNKEEAAKNLAQQILNITEEWIRYHKEQWFWIHDRWKL
jgi:KDO2-lipid IV(A) lauroyltransferase